MHLPEGVVPALLNTEERGLRSPRGTLMTRRGRMPRRKMRTRRGKRTLRGSGTAITRTSGPGDELGWKAGGPPPEPDARGSKQLPYASDEEVTRRIFINQIL